MVGLVRSGSNWSEDSAHIACSHAATLNEEEFELDITADTIIPKNKNSNFLSKVEEQIDLTDQLQVERLEEIKKLIMNKMKSMALINFMTPMDSMAVMNTMTMMDTMTLINSMTPMNTMTPMDSMTPMTPLVEMNP